MSDFTIATMDTSGAKSAAELAQANQANAQAEYMRQHAQSVAQANQKAQDDADREAKRRAILDSNFTPDPSTQQAAYDPSRRGIAPGQPVPTQPVPVQAPAASLAASVASSPAPQPAPTPYNYGASQRFNPVGNPPTETQQPQQQQILPSLGAIASGAVSVAQGTQPVATAAPGGPPAQGSQAPSAEPSVLDPNHPIQQIMSKAGNAADTSGALHPTDPTHADTQVVPGLGTLNRAGVLADLYAAGMGEDAEAMRQKWITDDAAAQKSKLENGIKTTSIISAGIAAFKALPDSMKVQAYPQELAALKAAGVDPAQFGLPATYDPADPKTNAAIDNLASQATSAQDKLAEQHKNAEDVIRSRTATTAEATQQANANYQTGELAAKAASLAEQKREFDAEQAKAATTTGGAITSLDDIKDPQTRATLKAVADGTETLEKVYPISLRPGAQGLTRQQAMGIITQAIPGWNSNLNDQAKKTLLDFASSGTSGKSVTSLNGLSEHLNLARELAPRLNAGDVVAWNQLGQALHTAFGANQATNFELLAGVLGGETDKFMSGGNPTKEGAAEWQRRLKASGSPSQIGGALSTLQGAVKGKFAALDQQYYNATANNNNKGVHLYETNQLTPDAKALFGNGVAVPTPSTPSPAPSAKVTNPSLPMPKIGDKNGNWTWSNKPDGTQGWVK